MLYLDTSAFVKCYFKEEAGSEVVIARAIAPDQELFTSVLTFAEMQSVMARKHRERQISLTELARLRKIFESDWSILVSGIELTLQTMAALPGLVQRFRLKAGDAVQLSTAIWLKNNIVARGDAGMSGVLEFGVADRDLADIARKCELVVFNPEEEI